MKSLLCALALALSSSAAVWAQETGSVLLATSSGDEAISFDPGESAYVVLADPDLNEDASAAEAVVITLMSVIQDSEKIELTETGPDTGVFSGSIPLMVSEVARAGDGTLQSTRGERFTATYRDDADDFGNVAEIVDTAYFAASVVSGPISSDATWSRADSPFIITGDVVVESQAMLTIEAGVEARFLPSVDDQVSGRDPNRAELVVNGVIEATGSESEPIGFVSDRSAPQKADWYGIRLEGAQSGATFDHVLFAHASYGLQMENLGGPLPNTIRIANSRFENLDNGIDETGGSRHFEIVANKFVGLERAAKLTSGNGATLRFDANTVTSGSLNFELQDRLDAAGNTVSAGTIEVDRVRTATIVGNTLETTALRAYGSEARPADVTIQDNTVSGFPGDAVSLYSVTQAVVRGNQIEDNGATGLSLMYTSAVVDSNRVSGNGRNGITVGTSAQFPVSASLKHNTISGNGQDGVFAQGVASPVVQYNNLVDNARYDLRNDSESQSELNARFNWWGETTTAEIELGGNPKNLGKVYDQLDNPAVDFVNYSGHLGDAREFDKGPSTGITTGLARGAGLPSTFQLSQNYPNPFNPRTSIQLALPDAGVVEVAVFTTLGRRVATLVNGVLSAGYHDLTFDASSLPSGVYLYSMRARGFTETRTLVLLK